MIRQYFPRHSEKREVCSEPTTKFSSIQFFVWNVTISRYGNVRNTVQWVEKIIRDSRILADKKASDFLLSWIFIQNLLLAGRDVLLKKRCRNGVLTPNIKEDWFAYKNFHTWSSCFTLVLRCYTRDDLSFIHLCCSRRYT